MKDPIIKNKRARDLIAATLGSIANQTCEEFFSASQEPSITTSVARAIERAWADELRNRKILKHEVRVIAHDLPSSGPNSLERRTGADLYIGFDLSSNVGRVSKGVLIQAKKHKNQLSTVTQLYHELIQASRGTKWVWALTVAIGIEGLAELCDFRKYEPTPEDKAASDQFTKYINAWSGDQRLKSIAVGAVSRATNMSIRRFLRSLVEEKAISAEQLAAWEKIRNSVAHGKLVSPYSTEDEDKQLHALSVVPDPVDAQSFNRFSYVINNPLSFTDPTGHGFEDIRGAVGGSVTCYGNCGSSDGGEGMTQRGAYNDNAGSTSQLNGSGTQPQGTSLTQYSINYKFEWSGARRINGVDIPTGEGGVSYERYSFSGEPQLPASLTFTAGNSGQNYRDTNGDLIQVAANGGPIYAPNGRLTLGTANNLFRNGGGVPVIVDASKYDFSAVNPNGFNARGRQLYTFPKFKDGLPSEDFLVDGTVTLQMNLGGQSFHVLPDIYDFDMHSWSSQPLRNIETLGAHVIADPTLSQGVPFSIIFQGDVPIRH